MTGLASARPYVAPVSEFTTPCDQQRERIASAFGWDPQGPLSSQLQHFFPTLSLALGAMGPRGVTLPRTAPTPQRNVPPTPEMVESWLADVGLGSSRRTRDGGGTHYVDIDVPGNPSVRFPTDAAQHAGMPRPNEPLADFLDTGTFRAGNPERPPWTHNQAGGAYSDWANLQAALRWRTSRSPDGQWLIPPDQAPMGLREAPTVDPARARLALRDWRRREPEGTRNRLFRPRPLNEPSGPDPRQMQLLGVAPFAPFGFSMFDELTR